jgi:hypothetical protein
VTGPTFQTFVFETTNAALWAEEVAKASGIPVEVVPAPAAAEAKCDLALVTPLTRGRDLAAALSAEGVTYRRWPQEADASG